MEVSPLRDEKQSIWEPSQVIQIIAVGTWAFLIAWRWELASQVSSVKAHALVKGNYFLL